MRWIFIVGFVMMTPMVAEPNSVQIRTKDLSVHGIRLTSLNRSDAITVARQATNQDVPVAMQPALRYSALLHNDTAKSIVAYVVRWKRVSNTGQVSTRDVTLNNLPLGRVVPVMGARSIELATLIPVQQLNGLSRQDTDRVLAAVADFDTHREVSISVDLVVFADGTAIGPDESLTVAKCRGIIDGERDIIDDIKSRAAKGQTSAQIVQSLVAVVSAQLPPLSEQPDEAARYRYYYQYNRRFYADHIVGLARERGSDFIHNYVHNLEAAKTWLAIRKN